MAGAAALALEPEEEPKQYAGFAIEQVRNAPRIEPLKLPEETGSTVGYVECCGCGEPYALGDKIFTGASVYPAGRWMIHGTSIWHMCYGYGHTPSATRNT